VVGCGRSHGLQAEAISQADLMMGPILVRNVESGAVEVGPIKTTQGIVWSVAYSPLGDRIASGGHDYTICIWDSHTGELLVGLITDLGHWVI